MAKEAKKGPAKKGKKATLGKQKLKGKNPLIHGKNLLCFLKGIAMASVYGGPM